MLNNSLLFDWEDSQWIASKISAIPQENETEILSYLKKGNVLASAPAIVEDVFSKQVFTGPCLYTDGVWIWDDVIIYYVGKYHYKLEEAFVLHMKKQNWKVPKLSSAQMKEIISTNFFHENRKAKLRIGENSFFIISTPKEMLFTEDDVCLSVVVNGEEYFIEQDSFQYEIGYMLHYFSKIDHIQETQSEDIGYDVFLFERDLRDEIDGVNLHQYDVYYAFFNNDIAVLFYKKEGKLFCQITKNNFPENYQILLKEELSEELLLEWRKILKGIKL